MPRAPQGRISRSLVCILSNNQIFHIGDRGGDENSGPKNSFSRPCCRCPAGARAPPHGEKTQNWANFATHHPPAAEKWDTNYNKQTSERGLTFMTKYCSGNFLCNISCNLTIWPAGILINTPFHYQFPCGWSSVKLRPEKCDGGQRSVSSEVSSHRRSFFWRKLSKSVTILLQHWKLHKIDSGKVWPKSEVTSHLQIPCSKG